MLLSAPATFFSFLTKAFILYLFFSYNSFLWDPNNRSSIWMWSKSSFWNQDEMANNDEPTSDCVESNYDNYSQLVPMTDLEKIITQNESCHSTIKITSHRIVNGQPVALGSRLFQIALFRRNRFACGGSFVSRRFVLTAAHCVEGFKPQELKIRYATRQYESGPMISINSIYKYPNYNSTTVENDLALLRLVYPLPRIPLLIDRVELNQNVDLTITANKTVIVSGWGRTGRSLPISKRLMMATLKTVDTKLCQEQWATMFKVHPSSMICAADPDRSACNGDSGGPLTLDEKLIGIVSVGSSNCLSTQRPNVYTNVAYFYQWIQYIINANS